MKLTKISTKIKIIGALLVILMLSVIVVTIYLNQKNIKDALIINIAGKERMLTQKISKNVFYLYHKDKIDFSELDYAVEEFVYNINSLKDGNDLRGISAAPTDLIAQQISKVLILWSSFDKNVQSFKNLLVNRNRHMKLLESKVNAIYNTNNILLQEVDNLVTMYTNHTERKTNYIRKFQYGGALVLFILMVYSLFQLRIIESHANEFLSYSKKLAQFDNNDKLEPINIEAECEIVEVSNSLNCFINKINSAMDFSNAAIEQSLQASNKLEEISEEFNDIIDDMSNSSDISKQLNISEDIVIESTEELINSTKKLQHLKTKLDSLILQCKS